MFSQRVSDQPCTKRAGFTLIEILMAVAILAILIGLLLPAIMGGSRAARIQEVKTDIDRLNTAMTDFKREFQRDVPGSITLCEATADWTVGDGPRSRGIIRQLWPQFTFGPTDFNADGDATDVHTLEGAECLVFFLGGMVDFGAGTTGTGALVGFSKNPVAPFAYGGNRRGPFIEFRGGCNPTATSRSFTGRLVDTDADGFPEYLDTLPGQTRPYLYFETGYRFQSDGGSSWVNSDNWGSTTPSQRMPRAYYQLPLNPTFPAGAIASIPHNRTGYQIISAGSDYEYGLGGAFDATDPGNNTGLATEDRDNITNFHSGLLYE